MRRLLCCLLPAACCLLPGCGGPGKANVIGRVTYQGKPVVTGTVVVRGPDGVEVPGTIQPDGSYTVQGVMAGAVKIAVVSRDPAPVIQARAERAAQRGRGGKGGTAQAAVAGQWVPLPTKYESPDTSDLAATLAAGANTHDIELP